MIGQSKKIRSQRLANARLLGLLLLCLAALAALGLAMAGQQGRPEIISDDFTKPRPTPTPKTIGIQGIIAPKKKPTPTLTAKHYRFVASSTLNTPPLRTTDKLEQLGVTLWRLRPAAARPEATTRLLVRENDKSSEWIPERAEIDSPLRAGDRVRLSIESPRDGYLYIVGRDLFADGTLGNARVLFPTSNLHGGNNQLRPGKLIDLPSQQDEPNYFPAQATRNDRGSDQVAEILTIIVTTTPLDLQIGEAPLSLSVAEFAKWEKAWGSATERFELEGGAGQSWTKEEKEASFAGTRPLTPDAPPPQTIYRIASPNKTGFLVNVRLSYAR